VDATVTCVHRQWFLEVILSPCRDFHDRIMSVLNAVLPEGPKIAGIKFRFSVVSLAHGDISRISAFFDDIMNCR